MTNPSKHLLLRANPWRLAGWSLAALVLLLPLAAMQLTSEVRWDATDFLVMAMLVGGLGLGIEFVVRRSGSLAYRLGGVVALTTAFLTIWTNLAVGMIGPEDNPYNLLFGGAVLLALLGAIAARFEASGMRLAMLVAALAQALTGAIGLWWDGPGGLWSIAFALFWLAAAGLFDRTARRSAASKRTPPGE